jgi:hypothetical protein
MDHCNGLILCDIEWRSRLCVCNPATQRWTLLPLRTEVGLLGYAGAHFMFDPAVSPHYEVVLIPAVPKKPLRADQWKVKKKKKRRGPLPRQHETVLHGLFVLIAEGHITS